MKQIGKHIFLILALLMVVFSVLCYVLLEQGAPGATDEQYLSAVRDRVRAELAISSAELNQVADKLQKTRTYSFNDLRQQTRYPYFVYRNGELLFWSDYRFVPEYRSISFVERPQLIDFEQGRYLISRRDVKKKGSELTVVSLINVYRQYKSPSSYLQSGYNTDLFAIDPQKITNAREPAYQNIYDPTAGFLFSVVPPRIDDYRNHSTPVNTVILGSLAILFLGLYVLISIGRLHQKRHYGRGFVLLVLYLVVMRGVMLYYGVPFLFYENDLFNPKFYASSILAPSLGDLLLNCLVVAILLLYLVFFYYRSRHYLRVVHWPVWTRWTLAVGCVVLSYVSCYACFVELNNIYEKSQFTLDITISIRFSGLKIACLTVFVLISLIYFLAIHLLASLFIRLINDLRMGFLALLIGTLLAGVALYTVDLLSEPIWVINGLFFLILYITRFPRTLYSFRYRTSIYLFFSALVCACITTYVVYRQEIRKDVIQKREYGSRLLAENDELGEFLLSRNSESIARDTELRTSLEANVPFASNRIQGRIKTSFLDKYFNRYDTEVLSFKANGQSLDSNLVDGTFEDLQSQYVRDRYRTAYPGMYFVNEVGSTILKQYVKFIDMRGPNNELVGHIVLTLRLWSGASKRVYPELLAENPLVASPESQDYSYGIFSTGGATRSVESNTHGFVSATTADTSWGSPAPASSPASAPKQTATRSKTGGLMYSAGSYNYERKLPASLLADPALYDEGVVLNGYKHVGMQGKNDRSIVVSSPDYPSKNILSNFSFLYLLLVLTVLIVIIIYGVKFGLSRFGFNYSTRIQILLNVAFFLPLLLVVLIILSVISSNYVNNQEAAYIGNTRNVAANFMAYLDEFVQNRRSKAAMEEELKKIARDAGVDINLFDTRGRLFSSTRQLMYEGGHLAKFINPEAYIHLIEDKENQVLLDELLGSRPYRTAYANIKAYDGRSLGVLSIPFFYARPELDRQLSEVIASALNVFMLLFTVFMILSYAASTTLTKPLRILTQKIGKTNLDKLNEPLEWKSDDEIGMLIGEYNRMLVKLEDSKLALSQSEKQSAWREMAKQVVHEIKNPLTPMKLTLQQLQRTLPAGEGDTRARRILQRTFDSLIEQIDNLSDIATSFSEFAKMPLPKNETFEITSVLNKTADLYADDTRVTLTRQVQKGPIMVTGDRHMMGRILTNLIINGIQSVPSDRRPTLELRLSTNDTDVNIEVHDNGLGIPEGIQPKVFLPNFSTKQGGSGLGLAIAKRGIEHAGGSIWFETVSDTGTSFFLSLPLANGTGIRSSTRNGVSEMPNGVIKS
ncbi:MAG: sensor histidine kinase [Cytophagales bacterium]|nr:MAG: sensor histidine kinase [Cytophagales bacterium]